MSQENVELVRRVSEAFNQAVANDDPTPVLRDFLDPDIYRKTRAPTPEPAGYCAGNVAGTLQRFARSETGRA
jgi:hypothetical protein